MYAATRSRGQNVERAPVAVDNKITGSINIEFIFIMPALAIAEHEAELTSGRARACAYVCAFLRVGFKLTFSPALTY